MNTNEKEQNGERIRNPEVSYEHRDLSVRAVFGFFIVLAVVGVLIHFFVWGLFKDFGKSQFSAHPTTNPIGTSNEQLKEIGGDPAVAFPAPQLQPDPTADLNKFRAAEEEELNSYGWVDPKADKIHVPIERAMDLLVASGLPQRTDTGAQAPTKATPRPQTRVRPGTAGLEGPRGKK